MEENKITVNGVDYLRADSIPSPAALIPIGDKRIIVADRGWVFVGDCVDNEDGSVTIHDARNIRRWGTTKGLGELANGPTSKTTTNDYGTVNTRAIVTIAVVGGW